MATTLTLRYDRESDILYLDRRAPHAEQESEEIGDGVIARLNPESGEIDSLEVLYFSTRLAGSGELELPVESILRRLSVS